MCLPAGGEAEERTGSQAGAGQVPPGDHRRDGPPQQGRRLRRRDAEVLHLRTAGEEEKSRVEYFT